MGSYIVRVQDSSSRLLTPFFRPTGSLTSSLTSTIGFTAVAQAQLLTHRSILPCFIGGPSQLLTSHTGSSRYSPLLLPNACRSAGRASYRSHHGIPFPENVLRQQRPSFCRHHRSRMGQRSRAIGIQHPPWRWIVQATLGDRWKRKYVCVWLLRCNLQGRMEQRGDAPVRKE
jgi:hypothetical protein